MGLYVISVCEIVQCLIFFIPIYFLFTFVPPTNSNRLKLRRLSLDSLKLKALGVELEDLDQWDEAVGAGTLHKVDIIISVSH